jgi:hypothetical protein
MKHSLRRLPLWSVAPATDWLTYMLRPSVTIIQRRSWPGGSGGPDPPGSARAAHVIDPNPLSFFRGGGVGGLGGATYLASRHMVYARHCYAVHFSHLRSVTCVQ